MVGGSKPAERLGNNEELKKQISYKRLLQIRQETELISSIREVLRELGTRFPNRKARAIAHNLRVLENAGGPKFFIRHLTKIKGPNADRARIRYFLEFKPQGFEKGFIYIRNKSARDLLMQLGVVRNALAFDTRLLDIFEKVGIIEAERIRSKISNPRIYERIEDEILGKICRTLGLSGVEFDRMLYWKKDDILKLLETDNLHRKTVSR